MTDEGTRLSRRDVIGSLAMAGLMLAGCDEAGTLRQHYRALDDALFHGSQPALTRDEVAKFQAASISMQIGRLAPRLVLLSRIEGRDLVWRASTKVLIATRGGRLTATGGLQHNLKHTDFTTPDPVDGGLLRAEGVHCTRLLDFSEDYGIGIDANSTFELGRHETLNIIGSKISTIRVTERVRVPRLSWRHKNTYWADATTGAVWKSRQYLHPDYAALTITTLRPARPV